MTEELKELVRYRMEQAGDAVRAATALMERGLPRDSVNRSYYAMFYGVLALLATRGLGTSKHSGAISLFDREFVKSGHFSRDLSAWIHEAFNKRLQADYADMAQIGLDDAALLVREAADFVDAVEDYLGTLET